MFFKILTIFLISGKLVCCFDVPKAKFEVFYPKGFQVSIPAEDGITLFAFHGKLNEEMEGLEAGQWARDIVTPKNGRFYFRDRGTRLKVFLVIFYLVFLFFFLMDTISDKRYYLLLDVYNF